MRPGDFFYALAQLSWLGLPIVLAGLVQVAVLRYRLAPALARPIDMGWSIAGARLFGDHKTLRGFVIMIAGTAAFFGMQVLLSHRFEGMRALGVVDYRQTTWWFDGAVFGAGYVLAELPNSLLKRRLGIGPGQSGEGLTGVLFLVLDQVDGVLGVLVSMCVFYVPTPAVALQAFVLFSILHVAVFNVLLFALGLKRRLF